MKPRFFMPKNLFPFELFIETILYDILLVGRDVRKELSLKVGKLGGQIPNASLDVPKEVYVPKFERLFDCFEFL